MPSRQMTRKQSIHHAREGETLEGIKGVYRSLENHFNDLNNNEINTFFYGKVRRVQRRSGG